MRGMLTQFAAATAAKGTYLPIRGGADYRIKEITFIVNQNRSQIKMCKWALLRVSFYHFKVNSVLRLLLTVLLPILLFFSVTPSENKFKTIQ